MSKTDRGDRLALRDLVDSLAEDRALGNDWVPVVKTFCVAVNSAMLGHLLFLLFFIYRTLNKNLAESFADTRAGHVNLLVTQFKVVR